MRRVLIIGMVWSCCRLAAQTQLAVTANRYALQLFNPAYAGTEEHINVSVYDKSQWLNTEGSPSLQGISAHVPFNYERLGAGLTVLKESTSTVQSLYFSGSGSYKINFKNGRLSFGLRLGFLQRNENLNSLVVKDPNDPLLSNARQFVPEAGGGVFYKEKRVYLGLSFVRSAGIYLSENFQLKNYYHLVSGLTHPISEEWKTEPYARITYTQGFKPYAAFVIPLTYRQLFSAGMGYSSSSVLSVVCALHLDRVIGSTSNKYVLSYSYDQSVNRQIDYIGNTHELILTIKLVPAESPDRILKRKVTVSPLFFD